MSKLTPTLFGPMDLTDLRQRRNLSFLTACRSIVERNTRLGRPTRWHQVVEAAVATPATAYYVERHVALAHVREMMRTGVPTRPANPVTGALWREVYERTVEWLRRRGSQDVAEAVTAVLRSGRASRHFISLVHGRRLFEAHFRPFPAYRQVAELNH